MFHAKLVDALAGVASGVRPESEMDPSVFEDFRGDFFHAIDGGEIGGGRFNGCLDFSMHAAGGAHLVDEVLRGIGGFDLAVIDDDDPIRDHFDFRENMGGNEDRVVQGEAFDQLPDLADLDRIEAVGWLVEDEELGLVDEGISQADPLAVTLGEGFDHFPADAFESAGIDDMGDLTAGFAAFESFELSAERKIFADPHIIIEWDVFWHIAYTFAGLDRVSEDVKTRDGGSPAGRR